MAKELELENNDPQRRVKIIINPRYQFRYVLWLAISSALLISVTSFILYSFVADNYELLAKLTPVGTEARVALQEELKLIGMAVVGVSAAFVLAITLIGLAFSHRTAGPLYRFQRVFEEVKAGDMKARIKLRPNDDFRPVADSFNHMMDTLEKRMRISGN